jgi:hypothetical protein
MRPTKRCGHVNNSIDFTGSAPRQSYVVQSTNYAVVEFPYAVGKSFDSQGYILALIVTEKEWSCVE